MIIQQILYEIFKGTPLSNLYKRYCKDDDLKSFLRNENSKLPSTLNIYYFILRYFDFIKNSNMNDLTIIHDIEKISFFLHRSENRQKLGFLLYFFCYKQFFDVLTKNYSFYEAMSLIHDKYPNITTYYGYLKFCFNQSYPIEALLLEGMDWGEMNALTFYKYSELNKRYYRQIINFLTE